jgi:DNA-binding IclR family transcriptional regulator
VAGNSEVSGQSVIGKGFRLLQAMVDHGGPVTASHLGRGTGLPTTTVLRILHELESHGAVQRTDSGRFELGLELWRLGTASPAGLLRRTARPALQRLHGRSGENVNLAVFDSHGEAVTIEMINAANSWSVVGAVGTRMPLHATAAGKVLLAFSDDSFIRRVLAAPLTRYTPFTITNRTALSRQIDDIRRTGVAFAGEEMNLGTRAVAAPVFRGKVVVAAVSLVGNYMQIDERREVSGVCSTAAEISAELTDSTRE